jgi:hypothetical protein
VLKENNYKCILIINSCIVCVDATEVYILLYK